MICGKESLLGNRFLDMMVAVLEGHTSCSEHCEMRKTSAWRLKKKGRKVLYVPFSTLGGRQECELVTGAIKCKAGGVIISRNT